MRIATAAAAASLALTAGVARADSPVDPDPQPSDVAGTLTASGDLSGTVEIDFLVDPSGSYTATITVDGSVLVTAAVTHGSGHLFLNTATLTDGGHSVIVSVGDADATDTVWSGTIETNNALQGAAGSGEGASATGPSAAGAGASSGSAGAGGGAASTVSAPSGGGCADAHVSATLAGGATQTVSVGASATLRGTLDCDGAPLAGATIDLTLATAAAGGATATAQIASGADGSFSYTVPPGPSRNITVAYDGPAGPSAPAALTTLSLRVLPRVTLAITPARTTNGHTITFTGRVSGGAIPVGGLPLDIEYREGSRWMIYDVVRASARSGRFTYRYTFERTTESITYSFRVAIPATGVPGYPFLPAASPARSVHVDP